VLLQRDLRRDHCIFFPSNIKKKGPPYFLEEGHAIQQNLVAPELNSLEL